jgi:DNA-binding NtrC family response regulator
LEEVGDLFVSMIVTWMPGWLEEVAARAADSDGPVFIVGEPGVGKETLARRIHRLSRRSAGPLLAVNCAGVPDPLLVRELFGDSERPGRGYPGAIRLASGGTLLLSEVCEISAPIQQQILQAMGRGRLADVRVIADSNRDPEVEVRHGYCLKELVRKLSGLMIRVPPLRERRGDILPLAREIAADVAAGMRRPPPRFSDGAARWFENGAWVGNVRVLRLVLERAMVVGDSAVITTDHLPRD